MLPVLAVLAAAMLFGTTGTAQALGPDGASPLAVGTVRLALGGLVLAVVAAFAARRRTGGIRRPAPTLTGRAVGAMAVTAVCLAAFQPLFFFGTARNGVAVATVVALGSTPVVAGILEWALTRRRPTPVWLAATALATAGVVLLGMGGSAQGADADPLGLLCSVLAGASFAGLAVAQRRLLDAGWDPFVVVGAMGAGSGLLAAAALPFVDIGWLADPAGVAMALWLGLATIVVAYLLFTWGLSGLTAATASTLALAEPLTAAVLGVFVLGERLSTIATAGLAVLAAGLIVLALGARRHPVPVPIEG